MDSAEDSAYDSAVALVGMAGRFPGAADVDALWRNLVSGVSGLRAITADELAAAGVDPDTAADPEYVRVGGPVPDLDLFDAATFGLSPSEAETMDPQHRIFLECAWEALEHAGYRPVDPDESVGVFAGCAYPDYLTGNLAHRIAEPGALLQIAVGNERDSLTSLVSYKLGLRGPSVTVQTFCSTSLVAVHMACQSLLTYECGLALAGGAFLPLPQPTGYRYEPGGILSPDGVVRSFDAGANGSVMGSGVGIVALKRMSDAIADGDVIHAVILGTAVNNDGRAKAGYTAPGLDGQATVIETAMAVAGVKPSSIGYVECHATGTPLGDSIELAAMTRAFGDAPGHAGAQPCVLGSVKPAVGHLDRASGVTGLIRAAMSLRHETLPGTPGFQTPNPALAATDRFTVLSEPRPWPEGPEPRRAGVSSFGLGGTNAHAVLEQAPARLSRSTPVGTQLLTFSAGDETALAAVGERLRAHLAERPDIDLADVAYTLQLSRTHFALRRAVVVRSVADAVAALADPTRWIDGTTSRRDPLVSLVDGEWSDELLPAVSALLSGSGTTPKAALADGLAGLGVRLGDGGVEVRVAPDGQPADEWVLATVAQLWLAGCAIDWRVLHRGAARRVELPTYPFQRTRYWVDAVAPTAAAPRLGRTTDRSKWTFLPTWKQRPLDTAELGTALRAAGPWLVLGADARVQALVDRLTEAGAEVATARPGPGFERDDFGDAVVRPDSQDDLAELLGGALVAPRTIVHGFSVGATSDNFDDAQRDGFHSALALVRALVENPEDAPANLVLLTCGASAVLGSDLRHPEHAAIAALAPTIAQENPLLSCRHVDLDAGSACVTDQVLAAIVGPHDGPVAARDGELWLRGYESIEVPTPANAAFRDGDTVLITGGLGDVGMVLARHLARTYHCRLVLTVRTELPPREHWLTLVDGDDRAARHIRSVLELEHLGAEVLAMTADVGDADAMRAVVAGATKAFGGIDVVVHAAGAQDPSFFTLAHLSTPEQCAAHFRAKVHGFHVLQDVLGEQAKDRRIAMSSVATVLGGPALGPYSAANAALDAYARVARRDGAGRWITVDWDTWHIEQNGPGPGARDYHMTAAEGVDVFERVLAGADRLGHVVISTGDLAPRLAQWVTGQSADSDLNRERHPRPPLDNPFVEPADGMERTIADIWALTLGLETVGATDDFFELGGHSLMAIQLATRIRAAVGAEVTGEVSPTALVEHPTVRALTASLNPQG
ncbi:MAG TPA: SDR family NAD(P)-dependent oxidoreductase [Actinokineospora sp.]|nr:SDR family NAD(P)-dependent oxidoreductase [Actinokineospora sp.]